MKKETCPWDETHPIRPIKSSEFPTGNFSDYWRKKMLKYNREPVFRQSEKYWELIKVLKSQTTVSHWLIRIDGQYFVINQASAYRQNEQVSIFPSDRRGTYNVLAPIAIYSCYIDLEAAADRFAQEYMAMLIDEGDPRVDYLFAQIEDPNS